MWEGEGGGEKRLVIISSAQRYTSLSFTMSEKYMRSDEGASCFHIAVLSNLVYCEIENCDLTTNQLWVPGMSYILL